MIQSNDLRRGNWVAIPELVIISKIDVIGEKKICINADPEKLGRKSNDFWLESLEGIKLFRKLLADLGFTYQEITEGDQTWDEYYLQTEFFTFSFKSDGTTFDMETGAGWVVGIRYLHQLQNLYYSIVGKELECDLLTLESLHHNS